MWNKKHSISPYQKQIQLPLNKTNRIPTYQLFLPLSVMYWKRLPNQKIDKKHTQQSKRNLRKKGTQNNSTLQEIETTPPIKNKGSKQASSPIKIGKTKQVLGKIVLGKILEVGKIKTHKPNLKTKLRMHMKKKILSFNKCKLDTMWPINSCMSRENICTLIIHHIS